MGMIKREVNYFVGIQYVILPDSKNLEDALNTSLFFSAYVA